MLSNIEIGMRISNTRSILGLTLEEVASKVGVAKSTILRYEKGSIEKIKLPVIESIANVLNVDPNWLIGNTDSPALPRKSSPVILSDDEMQLLKNYRDASEEIRSAAAGMLRDSAERNRREQEKKA